MILGIPNVGKSTLMNALLERHVAHVGDEPAITRKQMFHQLGPGMTLIDTPGMLWPELAQDVALKLAAAHSIGRAAYEDEVVALDLGRWLLEKYPELLRKRWGDLPEGCDAAGLLQTVSLRRNLLKKAGEPDIAKASQALLNDFRSGSLGRITLETVEGLTSPA
jgi:ribosome biogenesis GTPase A